MYGNCNHGMIIGLKTKERKYHTIIEKLLQHRTLSDEERTFLERQGIETN